jgi:hypothetical protein
MWQTLVNAINLFAASAVVKSYFGISAGRVFLLGLALDKDLQAPQLASGLTPIHEDKLDNSTDQP